MTAQIGSSGRGASPDNAAIRTGQAMPPTEVKNRLFSKAYP
jgi:hypothetical protein